MRIYCNETAVLTFVTPTGRTMLRHVTNGRVWASRSHHGHYTCEGCGETVPVAW